MAKLFTRSEVEQHNSNNSAWMVIGNKVYDVTNFLDEHPGGCEVLLEKIGEDRTEAFEDIGHSTDAREMKNQYCIGEIVEEEKWLYSYDKRPAFNQLSSKTTSSENSTTDSMIYIVLFAFIAAILYYLLLS